MSSQSSIQQATSSSSVQKSTNSKHFHSTRSNVEQLIEENIKLKNENALLKSQISVANEELNTYKNPGTSSLCSVLKYPVPRIPTESSQSTTEDQTGSDLPSPRKKRKTLPFSRLLTSEESWRQLEEVNREVERKADEARQKKELAAQKKEIAVQKKAKRELRLAQKNEKRAQKTLGKQKGL